MTSFFVRLALKGIIVFRAACFLRRRVHNYTKYHNNLHLILHYNHLQNTDHKVNYPNSAPRKVADCLADWPNNPHSQVMSPNITFDPHASGYTPANPTSRNTSFCSTTSSAERIMTLWQNPQLGSGRPDAHPVKLGPRNDERYQGQIPRMTKVERTGSPMLTGKLGCVVARIAKTTATRSTRP